MDLSLSGFFVFGLGVVTSCVWGGDCGGVYLVLRGVSLAGDVCAWLNCTLWFMLVLVLDFVGLSLIVFLGSISAGGWWLTGPCGFAHTV